MHWSQRGISDMDTLQDWPLHTPTIHLAWQDDMYLIGMFNVNSTPGVTRWYVSSGINNMSGVIRWYVPDWYVELEQYTWRDKMISTFLLSCVLICFGEECVSIHIHIHIHLVLSDDWDVGVKSWFVHALEPTRHQWHGHPTGLATPYTYNTSGMTRWYVSTGIHNMSGVIRWYVPDWYV